ncbi:MEDS domain-containing protein [Plantactinospora sp. GCM10030261]|uniref:MEDS domain-containing protein n=1 Tax=Plantactinospora sp. GCM10030261 TaxID=3273420 RepID=UPI0036204558
MIGDERPSYGHICLSYDDPDAFATRARAFLLDGLAAGERVWYVATGQPDATATRLCGVDAFAEALRGGAARIVPLDTAYDFGQVVDPDAQVAAYAAATEAALAAGYAGLRVVADATSLVRDPDQLDAFARYEHRVDRFMRAHPMSAMCGYDRRVLGEPAIEELACLHPETNVDVLFRLHARGPSDNGAALTGELDPSNRDLFRTALERADLRPVDGELTLEASALQFIDHRALIELQEYAQRRDATAVLRTSMGATRRLVELLDLSRVRVEVTP